MDINFLKQVEVQSNFKPLESFELKSNTHYTVNILASAIYQYPIQTSIQEYISNARDAHRRVGKDCTTIEIDYPTNISPVFRVRDYGCSVSPDKMKDLVIEVGASDKKLRDGETGGFGLGCKSGLAISDSFFFNVYYQQVLRVYNFCRDEEGLLKVNLQQEVPTTLEDGVEVIIPIRPQDVEAAREAITRCIFFWKDKPVVNLLPAVKENLLPDLNSIILHEQEEFVIFKSLPNTISKYNTSTPTTPLQNKWKTFGLFYDNIPNYNPIDEMSVVVDGKQQQITLDKVIDEYTEPDEFGLTITKEQYLKHIPHQYIFLKAKNVDLHQLPNRERFQNKVSNIAFFKSRYNALAEYIRTEMLTTLDVTSIKTIREYLFKWNNSDTVFKIINQSILPNNVVRLAGKYTIKQIIKDGSRDFKLVLVDGPVADANFSYDVFKKEGYRHRKSKQKQFTEENLLYTNCYSLYNEYQNIVNSLKAEKELSLHKKPIYLDHVESVILETDRKGTVKRSYLKNHYDTPNAPVLVSKYTDSLRVVLVDTGIARKLGQTKEVHNIFKDPEFVKTYNRSVKQLWNITDKTDYVKTNELCYNALLEMINSPSFSQEVSKDFEYLKATLLQKSPLFTEAKYIALYKQYIGPNYPSVEFTEEPPAEFVQAFLDQTLPDNALMNELSLSLRKIKSQLESKEYEALKFNTNFFVYSTAFDYWLNDLDPNILSSPTLMKSVEQKLYSESTPDKYVFKINTDLLSKEAIDDLVNIFHTEKLSSYRRAPAIYSTSKVDTRLTYNVTKLHLGRVKPKNALSYMVDSYTYLEPVRPLGYIKTNLVFLNTAVTNKNVMPLTNGNLSSFIDAANHLKTLVLKHPQTYHDLDLSLKKVYVLEGLSSLMKLGTRLQQDCFYLLNFIERTEVSFVAIPQAQFKNILKAISVVREADLYEMLNAAVDYLSTYCEFDVAYCKSYIEELIKGNEDRPEKAEVIEVGISNTVCSLIKELRDNWGFIKQVEFHNFKEDATKFFGISHLKVKEQQKALSSTLETDSRLENLLIDKVVGKDVNHTFEKPFKIDNPKDFFKFRCYSVLVKTELLKLDTYLNLDIRFLRFLLSIPEFKSLRELIYATGIPLLVPTGSEFDKALRLTETEVALLEKPENLEKIVSIYKDSFHYLALRKLVEYISAQAPAIAKLCDQGLVRDLEIDLNVLKLKEIPLAEVQSFLESIDKKPKFKFYDNWVKSFTNYDNLTVLEFYSSFSIFTKSMDFSNYDKFGIPYINYTSANTDTKQLEEELLKPLTKIDVGATISDNSVKRSDLYLDLESKAAYASPAFDRDLIQEPENDAPTPNLRTLEDLYLEIKSNIVLSLKYYNLLKWGDTLEDAASVITGKILFKMYRDDRALSNYMYPNVEEAFEEFPKELDYPPELVSTTERVRYRFNHHFIQEGAQFRHLAPKELLKPKKSKKKLI